jgi:dihydrofolate reductase
MVDMRKPLVRYYVAVSVDGFIAPPDGSVGWFDQARGGHGPAGEADGGYEAFVRGIGGIILGRETFDTEMSFGPWSYEAIPAVVMTNHPLTVSPKSVQTARGDPSQPLEALKAVVRHGDIWLLGGGVLAGQFLKAGRLDRVEITVLPIYLGRGRTRFGREAHRCVFDRVETRTNGGSTTIVLTPRGFVSQ